MKVIIFLLLITVAAHSDAEQVKFKELLLTAKSSIDVTIQKEKADYLKHTGKFVPLIRDAELRVGSKLSAINRPEYTIRVQPVGFGETRSTKMMMNALSENAFEAKQLRLNEGLLQRYELGLTCLEYSRIYELQEQLVVVYEDKIKVLEQKVFSGNADLSMVIDAEDDLTKLKSDHIELGREIKVLEKKIMSLLGSKHFSGIDTSGFKNVSLLAAEVDTMALEPDTGNVYMRYYRSEFKLTKCRYELERAESFRYIPYMDFSFDQAEYLDQMMDKNDSKKYDFKKAYSVEVGLKIPFFNYDRQTIARRKIDFLSDKEAYEKERIEMEDQMHKDIEDIKALNALYKHLQKRELEVDAEASLKKYLQMSGMDPAMVLSIKESVLKNSIKLENVKYSLMRNYIRVLDLSGKLSVPPLRNCISSNRELLE
ncbi:MAG TPA: TolC family protein [Chitinispirillaceae bacterium]|nr:TolC family protein [Chitinispirillaceae bacterium]